VQLDLLNAIETNDVAAFNRLLQELQVPGIYVAPRKRATAS
jgi:hypothetical protein